MYYGDFWKVYSIKYVKSMYVNNTGSNRVSLLVNLLNNYESMLSMTIRDLDRFQLY